MIVTKSKSHSHVGNKALNLVLPHITVGMMSVMKEINKRGPHQVKHFSKVILNALFMRKIIRRVKGSGDNATLKFTIRGQRLWLALR